MKGVFLTLEQAKILEMYYRKVRRVKQLKGGGKR